MISGYISITMVPMVNRLHVGTLYQGHFVFAGRNDILAAININFESLYEKKHMNLQASLQHSIWKQNFKKKRLHLPVEKAQTEMISAEGPLLLFFEQDQLY